MNRRRQRSPAAPLSLIATLLVGACTIISHERVAGWPQLQVREHHVPHAAMRDRCARYVGFGMASDACAEFNLAAGTCDIWLSADFPPSESMKEHERLHCAGHDHLGGTTLKRLLEAAP